MILHIDMDAFFASVEQLDDPALAGHCVIVGGRSRRGVVSAASYEARRYGVHSAMPVFKARLKCPHAVFLPPRMTRYQDISRHIMTILADFSPLVEPLSIDEAFVDVGGCQKIYGPPPVVATAVKRRIRDEIGLTCSVGIAPVKFLAKIASDRDKPDGLTVIAPDQVAAFVAALPIAQVPGVGAKALARMETIGIRRLGDVAHFSEAALSRHFGKFGRRLLRLAAGCDDSPVTPHSPHKSVSREQTLETDTREHEVLRRLLLGQAERVARDLRRLDLKARTVTLKLKHADFRQVSRSVTLEHPTDAAETLYLQAVRLLDAYRLSARVRLIGVGASALTGHAPPQQLDLFEKRVQREANWEKVDRAVDAIAERFGSHAVKRASLATAGDKSPRRGGFAGSPHHSEEDFKTTER